MGTKNNPGAYDCLAAAEPDEPMFILLARDPSAAWLVEAWLALRADDLRAAESHMRSAAYDLRQAGKPVLPYGSPKLAEAHACAQAMLRWQDRMRTTESPPA